MPLGILTFVVLARDPVRHHHRHGIGRGRRRRGVPAGVPGPDAGLEKTKEAVFLTAEDHSMVCWLFVGSALFSAVFAILGGQALLESWVLSLNMSPVQFMILSQAIIFVLGWPLEWTEIIVIFVPIFLPMLKHFSIDPILWGVLVFVNLQAAFLSPPVAMSAFYLKGVAPKHVTLNQIFSGMMPYMFIVIICMMHHVHVAGHDAVAAAVSVRRLRRAGGPHNRARESLKGARRHVLTFERVCRSISWLLL